MKDYYREIDNALLSYENFKPYHEKTMDWITDRIDWCWKWKKITKEEMEFFVDRVCKIYKEGRC